MNTMISILPAAFSVYIEASRLRTAARIRSSSSAVSKDVPGVPWYRYSISSSKHNIAPVLLWIGDT